MAEITNENIGNEDELPILKKTSSGTYEKVYTSDDELPVLRKKDLAPSTQGGESGALKPTVPTPSKGSTSLLEDIELESWKKTISPKPAVDAKQKPLTPTPVVKKAEFVKPVAPNSFSPDVLKGRINSLEDMYKRAIGRSEQYGSQLSSLDNDLKAKKSYLDANPRDEAALDDFNISVQKRNQLANLTKKEQIRANLIQSKIEESQNEIDSKLGNLESVSNSLSNVATQIKASIPKTNLSLFQLQNKITDGVFYAYAKLSGLSDEDASLSAKTASNLYPSLITGVVSNKSVQENINESFKQIEEIEKEYKPTKSIIKTFKDNDIPGLAAAIFDGGTSVLATMATSAPTGGVGMYPEMVGDAIYNYNKIKAKRLGISVEKLYEKDLDEVAIPATIGAISASLEKIGLEGISNAINKNISRKGVKEVAEFLLEGGKEAWTEWTQTGLEEYNKALAEGLSPELAGYAAWNKMTSEEGIESALKGAAGSAVSIGTGRAAKALYSAASGKKKIELKTDINKVEALVREKESGTVGGDALGIIDNEINNATAKIQQEVLKDVKQRINLTDENSNLVSNIESDIKLLDDEINLKKSLIDNPNLQPETKSILQTEITSLEVKKMELSAQVDEVIKNNSPIALKKNTSPTNEKYGTINRNDGKGVVDLTKEEYLREEGKLAGVEEQLNEQEDVNIQQQVDEEKADDRAVGDIAKEDNAYQESRQITENVSRENPDASILITPKGNDLNLTALYVGKENRGKGIGSKVLESVKKQADKVGKKVVLDATNELDEETDLERLGKFYEANGFTKVGDNKFEYNPNKGDIAKKGEAVSKEEAITEAIDNERGYLEKEILSEQQYIAERKNKKSKFRKILDKLSGVTYDKYLKAQQNRLALLNEDPLAYFEKELADELKWQEKNPEDANPRFINYLNDVIDNFKSRKQTETAPQAPAKEEETPVLKDVESVAKALDNNIELSGLNEGFVGNTYNSFDPRGDKEISDIVIEGSKSFAKTIERKGKKYRVVGLKLNRGAKGKTSGRDNYSFASIEDNGNLPSNIDEILTAKAEENIGVLYPNEKEITFNKIEGKAVESLLSKEQAPKQKEDEQEKPTKEDGKPLPKGVQGLRNEGERGEESPELRPEEEGIDLPENKEGNYNKQFAGAKKIYGEETTIEMPNGETKEAQFIVVELDSILASHNEVSFNDTDGFPKTKEGRNVNSRNYKGDKAAQLKVNSDATNLKPTIVISDAATTDTGVPVLSKEGIVVSGNGRTMAVKLSQKIAPQKYQAYKENLIKRAAKFGLDPNEVSKMKNPVLVKLDRSIGNYSVKLFDDYNGRFQKEESPIDKAIKRSTIIQDNPDLKERILSVIGRHETMSDLFESKEDRKELFKILLDNDVILKQEVAKYVTDAGEFTPDGKDVVNDILIATVLRPETLEATESVKAFRNKIINALPVLTANYRLGDNSLENELNEAVLLQAKIASMGNQSEFWKHLKQLGVFDVVNPNLVILNRIIESGNKNFKKFIVNYNKSMEIDENNLFGGTEVLTKKEIIDELKKTILDEKERQIISNLEELYRDFEQRRQDGAVEVDGRISKEEQAGEPKPTEEKVSGGLTEAEKSNLEAIGKDAGVNFQEVRNVYNKYGEGKPLSEITLEDYQRAEEKRGKGKEAPKQSAQEEIDNLFNVYESIEDSKGMEKRGAAEEFRNMQESIKSPTLKRIFDNIKDIHSQLEKQGLITKTKGCP